MRDNSLQQRVLAIERMLQDYATHRDIERLERQIVELRVEMRSEFSAVRAEMRAGDEATRAELREEIRAGDQVTRRELRDEIRAVDESLRGLVEERTAEIHRVVAAGDEETRLLMRVLHEELIERINTIGRG